MRASHTAAVLAMLSVACGSSTPRVTEPAPVVAEPTLVEPMFSVRAPSPVAPAPSVEVCLPGTLASPRMDFEFADDPIEPLPYGPRVADVPPFHVPRSRLTVRQALAAHGNVLRECYRWALHRRPDLRGELRVHLPIDRWGAVAAPTVEPEMADGEELSACVVDVLTGMSLDVPSSRDAVVSARLHFEPEPTATRSRRAPPRPHRPTARASTYAGSCMRVADEGRAIELGAPEPALFVRDSDPVVPSDGRPRIRIATPEVHASPSPVHIREMIRANAGAYRRCYADALTRDGAIEGRVSLDTTITPGGSLAGVTVASSNVTDAELVECLRSALAEVRFHPLFHDRSISVRYPFVLTPLERALVTPLEAGTIEELAANAQALLDEGNGAAALDRFETLIEAAPDHDAACAWNLAALEAALVAWPLGGARVEHAARRLAERLSSGHDEGGTCAGHASTPLLRAASSSWPLVAGDEEVVPAVLPELVIETYAWLAPVAETLPGLARMRERLAEAQGALDALAIE
jgi:hypothetical protein